MTITGFDVDSYNKPGLNFQAAFAQGYRACYIKLGGNNLPGNDAYSMSGYQTMVNAAFAAGFEMVGNYWMVGGHNTAASAGMYRSVRDPQTTFDVIDNEKIDSGNVWSSGECGTFLDGISGVPHYSPWHYANKSDWNAQSWPDLAARNVKGIVAYYNGSPFTNIGVNYPASLIKGHQFTSSATLGGLANIDADAFADDAFATVSMQGDSDMQIITIPEWGGQTYVVGVGYIAYLSTPGQLNAVCAAMFRSTDLKQYVVKIGAGDVQALMNAFGLGQFVAQDVHDLPLNPAQLLIAKWADTSQAVANVSPDVAAQIAAGIPAGITPEQMQAAVKAALDTLVLKPVAA